MEYITDRKALNDAIKGLSSVKVDDKIQRLLISAFYHRMLSGDNTFISGVLNAMPKGSRVNAARNYVEAYMFVKVGKNKDKLFTCKNTENMHDTVDDAMLEQVANIEWWTFKPEREQEVYSRESLAAKLTKQLNKAIEAANEAGDTEFADKLSRISFN
jgi:hypothetical protein